LEAPSLITICSIAFVSVFTLLACLALVFRATTELFPVRQRGLDAAVVAAISSAVAAALPGARVTKIEEER
jgi:hypothetical protein